MSPAFAVRIEGSTDMGPALLASPEQLDLQLELIRLAYSFPYLGWGRSKQLEACARLISLLCRQRQM